MWVCAWLRGAAVVWEGACGSQWIGAAVVVPVTVVVDGCDCVHGCECGWLCYCGGGRAGGLSLPGCGPARIGLGGAG